MCSEHIADIEQHNGVPKQDRAELRAPVLPWVKLQDGLLQSGTQHKRAHERGPLGLGSRSSAPRLNGRLERVVPCFIQLQRRAGPIERTTFCGGCDHTKVSFIYNCQTLCNCTR